MASLTETRPLKIYSQLLSTASASSASTASRMELLDHVRLHNIRVPEVVVEVGNYVLRSGSSIGDRRWDIMEQVVVAALDTGNDEIADEYSLRLREKFPDSQRVKLLSGMSLEAKGQHEPVSFYFKDW